MSEESTKNKMWGVKNMPPDSRAAATRAAAKEGISIGEWLDIAIREKIKADRSGGRGIAINAVKPTVNLADASTVIQMMKDMADIGAEPPESLKKQAFSLVRKVMADVKKGVPSVQPKPITVEPDSIDE